MYGETLTCEVTDKSPPVRLVTHIYPLHCILLTMRKEDRERRRRRTASDLTVTRDHLTRSHSAGESSDEHLHRIRMTCGRTVRLELLGVSD